MARASTKPNCPPSERLRFERAAVANGLARVAGVDEAGRGPLAGPVVAAAVVLPPDWIRDDLPKDLQPLNDSKQLDATQRERFFQRLTTMPGVCYGVATIDASVIDEINILQATHRAMNQALSLLAPAPQHVLVDGLPVPSLPHPQTAIVQGDGRSYSIAAASVLAKVTRDRLMAEYDRRWPDYGFARHKGYGTPAHLAALRTYGPCPIHRRSFAPLSPKAGELVLELFPRFS